MSLSRLWEKYLADDELLASSYDQTGELTRSWMKKHIACLFNCYSPGPVIESTRFNIMRAGFMQKELMAPVSNAFFIMQADHPAWNRLLAAVLPALSAGVPDIFVFLILDQKNEPNPLLLTALELAGIENIVLAGLDEFEQPLEQHNSHDCSVLVDLSGQNIRYDLWSRAFRIQKKIRLGHDARPRGLVWIDPDHQPDYPALGRYHSDVEFFAAGPGVQNAPLEMTRIGTELDSASCFFDIFFGPCRIFSKTSIPIGFTRGMEAFWIWPDLDPDFFKTKRYCWKEKK
ncbi:hypothetical protein [Desulfonatronovibrio hydrogenovorans]|uniref:hypothetical protein n=1 Tax=Desulfonatronovibrio hydrogenovorans TaxID=53245 RepID=UPI00048B8402|nr:hypothetical protein [Desulfonatronovibrio hydrogenovorans]